MNSHKVKLIHQTNSILTKRCTWIMEIILTLDWGSNKIHVKVCVTLYSQRSSMICWTLIFVFLLTNFIFCMLFCPIHGFVALVHCRLQIIIHSSKDLHQWSCAVEAILYALLKVNTYKYILHINCIFSDTSIVFRAFLKSWILRMRWLFANLVILSLVTRHTFSPLKDLMKLNIKLWLYMNIVILFVFSTMALWTGKPPIFFSF